MGQLHELQLPLFAEQERTKSKAIIKKDNDF